MTLWEILGAVLATVIVAGLWVAWWALREPELDAILRDDALHNWPPADWED